MRQERMEQEAKEQELDAEFEASACALLLLPRCWLASMQRCGKWAESTLC